MLGLYYFGRVACAMRRTTIAALAAAAAAVAAGGALASDSHADHSGACPAWSDQDAARAEAVFERIDVVMARYGFVHEEPDLSAEQEAALEAAMSELDARIEERLPEYGYWGAPTPEQAAEAARLYAEAEAEYDSILQEYGFVVQIPELSEQDEARMEAELEPLYAQLEELDAGCEQLSPEDADVLDRIDGVMAEYGFVYEEPDLSEDEERMLGAELDRLWSETEDLAERAGYDGYSVPTPEQAAEMARLYAEAGAEHDSILREYGFVIEEPDLSRQDAERLKAELEPLYDLLYDPARRH